MQVDDKLLSKLEKLSFLKVDENKREEIMTQLSEIVGFVDNLSSLNTDSIDDNFSMNANPTPTREDKASCNTSINDDIINNAPQSADHFFIVPKIIE
ncbi:MAG: Asp-tRNA(Asn)/Glu-tRNA(Gln) amidotransferase subunit GatC [Campylobacterota bacterium]|nr:Asp-tRNA(Asn)/Glu-tRNA(Gln) amidotransferase subunit GatC [Campylobacterota bacterium]